MFALWKRCDPSTSLVCLQADFNLSYAQLGLLPALYMAGLIVACLVFNELTNYVNSFRLVGTPCQKGPNTAGQHLLTCLTFHAERRIKQFDWPKCLISAK